LLAGLDELLHGRENKENQKKTLSGQQQRVQ